MAIYRTNWPIDIWGSDNAVICTIGGLLVQSGHDSHNFVIQIMLCQSGFRLSTTEILNLVWEAGVEPWYTQNILKKTKILKSS